MSEGARLQPGSTFGSLRVERELGMGGFGRVWLARDTRLNRPVALKVLHRYDASPLSAEERARFLHEARIIAGFNHPNIVVLYHLHADTEGTYALEMEYVEGGTLDQVLRSRRKLSAQEALAIARDLASALAAAHAAHVAHGDVKPGNVLVAKDGRVKLADFGLARLLIRAVTGEAVLRQDGQNVTTEVHLIGGCRAAKD